MRVTTILLLLVFTGQGGFAQKRPVKDKLLDKKTFWITMTRKSSKKILSFEDEMTFRSGKMGSRKLQAEQGFLKGDYAVTQTIDLDDDVVVEFQGINKNSKGRSLKWEGSVFGQSIEGTAIISKKGKIKEEYFFAGTLKVRGKKRK